MHNVLRAVRNLGRWTGQSGPTSLDSDIRAMVSNGLAGMALHYLYQLGLFALVSRFILVNKTAF